MEGEVKEGAQLLAYDAREGLGITRIHQPVSKDPVGSPDACVPPRPRGGREPRCLGSLAGRGSGAPT